MPKRKHSHTKRVLLFALILWGAVFAVSITETIYHVAGWIILTAIIAACSYYAGKRNMLARARRHVRKLDANARYGHNREPSLPEAYRGGSLPREPVEAMDAVSPYPPDMTTGMRARLLSDRLSGVRKLSDSDDG
jgi:hypothetical protein